jgi:quercetin dioxygenase-like cupin family protein
MDNTRIVTAVTGAGRSVIAETGPCPHVVTPAPGLTLSEQWTCDHTGKGILEGSDHTTADFTPVPPPGGVLFRVVTFPPDPDGQMHRTDTVDFVTILSGELVLALEDGDEATLGPGDTVIQRGATHAWHNRTDQPAVASVVLVSAERAA